MSNPNDDGLIPIRVEGPLPTNIAAALMNLIGSAWPDSMIQTDSSKGIALDMRVPNEPAKTIDQEFIDEIVKDAGNDDGTQFNGLRDGWVAFSPPEELCLYLGQVCHSLLEASEGAVNFLEWQVTTGKEPDDPSYVLSAARSKGQTPSALLAEAKALLQRHQAYNKNLVALLEKNGIEVPKEGS